VKESFHWSGERVLSLKRVFLFVFSALQSSKLFASCDEILLEAAFAYSAVALAASVAALPRCVLCGLIA
jgi:hypothetical protein